MEVLPLGIPGCSEVQLDARHDARGFLIKTFQRSAFAAMDAPLEIREMFFSRSHRGVLRGLHFQVPPHDMIKLVFCLEGSVLDAVVDLRVGSPTFGQHRVLELSADRANAVVVAHGCAHGFLTNSDEALVGYAVTEEYDQECDSGIHWSSAGIPWPNPAPVVSAHDDALASFTAFDSPFVYDSPSRS